MQPPQITSRSKGSPPAETVTPDEAEKAAPSGKQRIVRRARVECQDPFKRRSMCCCACFWFAVCVVFVVLAHTVWRRSATADESEPVNDGDVIRQCKANPACTVPLMAASIHRQKRCAPGYAHNARNWLSAGTQACARVHYFPRAFDSELTDTTTLMCKDPYRHACGAWHQWFSDSGAVRPLVPTSAADYHNQNLPGLIQTALADRESILHRFVHNFCQLVPIIPVVPTQDTADEWRLLQRESALPLWIDALKMHTVCVLAAIDTLMPSWYYVRMLNAPEIRVNSQRAALQATAVALNCSTTMWLGALGDPLIAQIDSVDREFVDHDAFHASTRGSYSQMWTLGAALAPSAWLAVGAARRMQMRVALPRNSEEFMRRSHCERIAAVVFTESLEDRYTAMIHRQNPAPVLSSLSLCAELTPRVTVHMDERSSRIKSSVWHCIEDAQPRTWNTLTATYAQCNAGHRLQIDVPLSDVFVPDIRVDADTHVTVTPAVLQAPWFSDDMALPSVAARLYWPILRAVADVVVEDVAARDEWALQSMQSCFRSLMDELFWKELLQLYCGANSSAARWTALMTHNPVFRRTNKCGAE